MTPLGSGRKAAPGLMTTAPSNIRRNRVSSWWGSDNSNPAERHITHNLLANGWVSEVERRLNERGADFGHDETWLHLPFGCRDPGAMDFCSLLGCKGKMERAGNVYEFLDGMRLHYKHVHKPIGFYMGGVEADPVLAPLWTTSRTAWYQVVEQAIRPIALLRSGGVPIMFGVDATATGSEQATAICEHLSGYGPVYVECRHLKPAAHLNTPKYGSITVESGYRDDYFGNGPGGYIPAMELVGRKIILSFAYSLDKSAEYAEHVRRVGANTGADVGICVNPGSVGTLKADSFRVPL